MTTEEGNILIAQFMDAVNEMPKGWILFGCIPEKFTQENHFFTPDQFEFHSSWDWLMPVVDKIDSLLGYSIEIYSLGANNKRMAIYSGGVIVVQSRLVESTIEAVYNCVIDFIKWYNLKNRE